MRLFLFSLLIIFISSYTQAQNPIDLINKTFKVNAMSEENIYCGFHEGDQLILTFEEINGKELKEFEIIEYPSNSKFMDLKLLNINSKTLNIQRTGIYQFRLYNSSISGRVCRVVIQRVPQNKELINFNSNVYWKTINDTSFNVIKENILVKSDTIISNITDKVVAVNSSTSENGNKVAFNFVIPENTISWSYYIGVGQEGQENFDNATNNLASKSIPLLSNLTGFGPMAALALSGVSYFSQIQTGEDITYYIIDNDNINVNAFFSGNQFRCYRKGKVISDYSKMTEPSEGHYNMCLFNDNVLTGVKVIVKITAIQVINKFELIDVRKMQVISKEVPYLKK